MKPITVEQMEQLEELTARTTPPPFTNGPFTFSVINPWSPYAASAIAAVEELIKSGEDYGMVIQVAQEVKGERCRRDFIQRDINVYRKFQFPDQVTGNISVNLRSWIQEHRLHNSKPSVKLKGDILDITEEKVPAGTWLIQNHFIVTKLTKDSTVAEVLSDYSIVKGTVVRFITFTPDHVEKLFKAFIVEHTFFGRKYHLFAVS